MPGPTGDFMVMGAGTDREYSQDIPIRVSHLESSVGQLHIDNQRAQTTLAGIVAQQEAQGRVLSDIADKLDKARTSKPELGALATVASVVLLIGVMAFAPVYREMDANTQAHDVFAGLLTDRAMVIADSAARLKYLEDASHSLEKRMIGVEANRFNRQDAQALESELRAEINRLKQNSGQP